MNYPTNSMEALQALNGHAPNGFSQEHFPAPPPAMRPHTTLPLAPPQNWPQQNQFPQQVQSAQYGHPWANQMPPQPFQNGIGALSFFPQQVIHDALALSHPVEPPDEPVLIKALLESRAKGETYKDALNRLHGTSGHSASLWKDYYLDNKDRIDIAVREAKRPALPAKAAKKPSAGAYKTESSLQSSSVAKSSSPAPAVSRSRRPSLQPARSSHEPPPAGRRRTINSITSHIPVYNPRIPPPNTELRIPDPPSRSPTPPTEVIPHNRGGNKFTAADKDYFIKFISWRLKDDPTLVRHELVELLAEKVPHHNANSWASYWSTHHDMPDKILAAMRRDDDGGEDEEEEEEEEPEPKPVKKLVVARKPRYADLSSDSELSEGLDEVEEENDESDDDLEIPEPDESDMGKSGGSFTKGDMGVVAKHVASFSNWRDASFNDKWTDFARRYPQRAPKSWNEYYRRNQQTLDRLARKIRRLDADNQKRQAAPPPPPLQPKPTWSAPDYSGPPRAKRKFVEEDSEDSAGKRAKAEGL